MKLKTLIQELLPNQQETDDEVSMIKGDLYHIHTYALELYKMLDQMQPGSYDFPHWWQSKIVESKHNISAAKHYLEHELQVSNTVTEVKSTCCGNCGRMHPKGTSCPKPYLTGKSHCKNRKSGK